MKKSTTPFFASSRSVEQVELGNELAHRFDAEGLPPAIVMNTADEPVLMLGYVDAQAFELTLTTKQAPFWSRSRNALWRRSELSGFTQSVERVLIDDDQDAVILQVALTRPGSCHVGLKSCFYCEIDLGAVSTNEPGKLLAIESHRAFDADSVYCGLANPAKL